MNTMITSTIQPKPWLPVKEEGSQIPTREGAAPSSPKNKPMFLKLKSDLSPREKQPSAPKRATYKIHGVNILNSSSLDRITATERFQRRRESHKKSERRRSQNINAAIAELAELVPEGAPIDKGGILRYAVEHIKDLHSENGTLKMRLQEMEQQRQQSALPMAPPPRNQYFPNPSPLPYLEPSPPLPPILPALSPIHVTSQSAQPPALSQQQQQQRHTQHACPPSLRELGDQQANSFPYSVPRRFGSAPELPSPPRSSPAHRDHVPKPAPPTASFGQQLQAVLPFSVDGMGWVYVPIMRQKAAGVENLYRYAPR